MVSVALSDDGRTAILSTGAGEDLRLDAAALDALTGALAAVRADMKPAVSGRYQSGVTPAISCDNLLWEATPDPARRGIDLALHHAGLGWLSLRLSRAQVEDLVTAIAFALADLGASGGQAAPAARPAVRLRRVGA